MFVGEGGGGVLWYVASFGRPEYNDTHLVTVESYIYPVVLSDLNVFGGRGGE